MATQLFRRSAYLAVLVLLLALSAALVASFNVQTARAGGGGGPVPLYQMISAEMALHKTFSIYTTTAIGGVNAYPTVRSVTGGSPYYISWLGTDFVCIVKQADPLKVPLCLPYSAIAGIKYH